MKVGNDWEESIKALEKLEYRIFFKNRNLACTKEKNATKPLRALGRSPAHVLTVVRCRFPWCMQVCTEKELRYGVARDLYSSLKMSKTHQSLHPPSKNSGDVIAQMQHFANKSTLLMDQVWLLKRRYSRDLMQH